jgi:polysaccharide biosynthesis protein VpsM
VQIHKIACWTLIFPGMIGFAWLPTASAQLLGIPQVSVEMPNPGPAPDQGPVGVFERRNREYQQQGIQLGRTNLQPALTVTPTYNSNIFATQSNPTSDGILAVRPEFTLDSGPGSTAYRFNAYGLWNEYFNNSGLSNLNGGGGLGVRAGSDEVLRLESATGFVYGHMDPSTFGSSVLNGPVPSLPSYTTFVETLTGVHRPGVVGAALSGSFARSDYQNTFVNGAFLNNSQFNGDTYTVSPKVSYLVAPPTDIFLQFTYARQAYDIGINDSSTYTPVIGSSFEFRRLFRGNAYVGYKNRSYDANGAYSAFTYGVNAAWYPTESMAVKISGLQDFRDTTVLTGTGGIGTVNGPISIVNVRTATAQVDYEFLPQLLGTVGISYENDNYLNSPQIDNIIQAGASLTYFINRNANLGFQYLYSNRSSTQVGYSYDRQLAQVALRVQY